ncbi:Succinate-semialdehyde dehydrogenase [NADP(+)] GabD [Paramyrothecium foliicola]|nr:Succinate-semialdehyde dehydrogenase [NADP(+)] GabD [Paramyrothecium foliicola]
MRYNPADPDWFDRDRFVLSNGHASTFLYAMNHLVGFGNWTMDELKGYASPKLDGYHTISHGHPEIQIPGIEVTTGPLGQGVANAVGLAIASKNLAANFNKDDSDIIQSNIWCTTGDGCLMEGVALEAISLAGHLALDNLVLIYDNNAVTCDGPLDWINTENTNDKMRAQGWHVIDVQDGTYDVSQITAALYLAKQHVGQPVFVNIRTVIGVGTLTAGTYKAHHGGIDKESILKLKKEAGLDPDSSHVIPPLALKYFRERKEHGETLQRKWATQLETYCEKYPEDGQKLKTRFQHYEDKGVKMLQSLDSLQFAGKATRQSNGAILEKLWTAVPSLCGGGADLVNSNQIKYAETDVFHPSISHRGRYLRNGIREHAMAAVANGLSAYHPGTFLPVTATFAVFFLYAAPSVRMGALSDLPVIHIATHDSFQEGQNGPTHQPVETDSLFRAMPNLHYFRPCDAEELIGCWILALQSHQNPCMLSLARDPVGPVPNTNRNMVFKGAYVIQSPDDYQITLASCGSNLHYAVAAAGVLESNGVPARLVSAPSLDLFEKQSREYKDTIFPRDGKPVISVEEYVATVWARYSTASIGMSTFGYSASNESNYDRFGLNTQGIKGTMAVNPETPLASLADPSLFISDAFVGGKWLKTKSTFEVFEPVNGSVISNVANLTRPEIQEAITKASEAQQAYYESTTASQRGVLLHTWYDLVMKNLRDLAIILSYENGKTLAEAEGEIKYSASYIRWFAEEAPRAYGDTIPSSIPNTTVLTFKQPIGVCGIITPWNFPAAMIARKIAPALAAGCSVVIKPPSETPHSCLALTKLAVQAGIPADCIQVCTTRDRAAATELATNPLISKLSFTGSTNVGKMLASLATGTLKKCSLELGGNAPLIVFDDADLDVAVEGAMASKFRCTGQTCVCANRILVHEKVAEQFTEKLVQKVKGLKMGSGFDPKTTQGPLVNAAAVKKVAEHVEDAVAKGAHVELGGSKPEGKGFFFQPTVISGVTPSMKVATEETFGPLAPIFRFKDEAEAIALANATEFGLASYLFTRDVNRVLRVSKKIQSGMVGVNVGVLSASESPFGGVKESGYGKEGSKYGLDEYQVLKSVTIGNNHL